MKILREGHKYQLENLEKGFEEQTIQFIEKELVTSKTHPVLFAEGVGKPKEGELYTVNQGTTNEEVLKVLINRLSFLYYKFPSHETLHAISSLQSALSALGHRTKERVKRGVEGRKVL